MSDYEKLGLILMLAVSTMLDLSRDYYWFQALLITAYIAGIVLFAAGGEKHD